MYYGCTTLLGGLTCNACDSPDAILKFADENGIARVFTGTGFSERVCSPHRAEICEFIDAKTAAALIFVRSDERRL